MKKADLLKEALNVVEKRGLNYGKPENNFNRIALFWTDYLEQREHQGYISEADVAAMMILMKVARLMEKPDHLDSWLDIAGYAACGAEVSRAGEPVASTVTPDTFGLDTDYPFHCDPDRATDPWGQNREVDREAASAAIDKALGDMIHDLAKPIDEALQDAIITGTGTIVVTDELNAPKVVTIRKPPTFKPGDAVVPRWVTNTNFHGIVDRVEGGFVYITWTRIDQPNEPSWSAMARPADLEFAATKTVPPPVAKEAELGKHVIFANPGRTEEDGA